MGKRITDEQIIQINEVFLECGVKSRTAQIVGVSASTVTKYLIPGYVSQKQCVIKKFNKPIPGVQVFINQIKEKSNNTNCGFAKALCEICKVSNEEWEELKEIQKGIMI